MYRKHNQLVFDSLLEALVEINKKQTQEKKLVLTFTQLIHSFPVKIEATLYVNRHVLTCTIQETDESFTIDLDNLSIIKILYPQEKNVWLFYRLLKLTRKKVNAKLKIKEPTKVFIFLSQQRRRIYILLSILTVITFIFLII